MCEVLELSGLEMVVPDLCEGSGYVALLRSVVSNLGFRVGEEMHVV